MQNLKRNFILIGLVVLFGLIPVKNIEAQWSEIPSTSERNIHSLEAYNNELHVATSQNGRIFRFDSNFLVTFNWGIATVDTISSFAIYNNELYAGAWDTINPTKGKIYKLSGNSWNEVYNTGEAELSALIVYNGELFIGTTSNGKIFKYDGTSWAETANNSSENYIYSFVVYNNGLYAGTMTGVGNPGKILKYNGVSWDETFSFSEERIQALAVYNGDLYAGTGNDGKIFRYNGANWSEVYDAGMYDIYSLTVYNGELFAGARLGKIFRYDGSNWTEYDTGKDFVFSFAEYNGKLYAGTGTDGKIFVYEGGGGPAPIPPIVSGGLIPCGRKTDNPNTPNVDERDECTICHFFLMIKNILDFVMKLAVIVAILFIAFGGLLYIFSTGREDLLIKAKGMILWALAGFVLIFAAWIFIALILSVFGYTDPLGGQWDVIC